MKKIFAAILVSLTLFSAVGVSVPLDTYQDFVTANPLSSRRGQWTQLLGRGIGTNDFYVIEVDPTTGAIPVSATLTDPTAGTPGNPVPAEAGYIAGIDENGDLRGLSVDTNGYLNVNADLTLTNDTNYGVVGNDTLRTAAQIGNATGAADFDAGPVSGQTLRVTVATDDVLTIRDLDSATDSVSAVQSGNWSLRLQDGSGNAITSTTGALDVNITTASLDIRHLSDNTDSVAIGDSNDLMEVNGDGSINVNVTAALPAGTNNIGDVDIASALPAGNNNIGDVDVTNFPATVDTNTGNASASTIRTVIATDQPAIDVDITTADVDIRDLSDTTDSVAIGDGTDMLDVNADGSVNVNVTAALPAGTNTIGDVGVTNLPATVATNAGAADASTLRVVVADDSPLPSGRSYADSFVLDYSLSNVTSGAWVEVDASTAADINMLTIFSSCGNPIELGVGAASSEARILIIPPGGLDAPVPLAIPAGSRLAVKALASSCTSGNLLITGLE